MVVSSRTPEGMPNRCPVCGGDFTLSPSQTSFDAPCPYCGSLVWFSQHHEQPVAVIDVSQFDEMVEGWVTGNFSVIILDFSNIEKFTSALLGKLITLEKKFKVEAEEQIKLVGLRPELLEIITTTTIDKLFDIYDNPEDAFANL